MDGAEVGVSNHKVSRAVDSRELGPSKCSIYSLLNLSTSLLILGLVSQKARMCVCVGGGS